jgi:hypothetical protein
MQLKDSTYISYGGKPAREAWYEGTLVWQASSFGWTLKPLAFGPWYEIEYGSPNTLVVATNNRYTYSTNNGDTWASPIFDINPNAGTESYNAIAYGNDTWVILEGLEYAPFGSQYTYTSVNPVTGWTQSTLYGPLTSAKYLDVLYSSYHGKYVAIGTKFVTGISSDLVGMYSTDGISWLSANYLNVNGVPLSDTNGFEAIAEGTNMPNNRLVACGTAGAHKFGYSDDGITWKQAKYNNNQDDIPNRVNLQTGHSWIDITYGYDGSTNLPVNGRYVAVCSNSSTSNYQFAYSDDGINWYGVAYSSPDLKRNWGSVVYGNGYFVALAYDSNYQAMSKDGKNWVAYSNMPESIRYSDITVANNRFVAVTERGTYGAYTADFIF